MRFRLYLIFLLCGLCPLPAFCGVEQISEKEFRELAETLAPKVNLFRETWKENPEAEFYGGTTRDYLYWLKGKFRDARTREEALKVVDELKSAPIIDVRDFIIGDSDVDIISAERLKLSPQNFGVRKIDFQPKDLLDPQSELGQNERLQGFIPAEKIRLGRGKLLPDSLGLGDGVGEIYRGKLTVTFASAEDFAKSKYAKEGVNHPILLAIRYLRLQAINYFREYGGGLPDKAKLKLGMTPESEKAVRAVIREAAKPGALRDPLQKHKFVSWLNGGIKKTFRSYTNPTAALELMKDFGVNAFPQLYPQEIETINQNVFQKFRDEKAIGAALKKYKVNEKKFYQPVISYFTDGKLYHGTKTEEAFRGILFQGALPSTYGVGGAGLYGVAEAHRKFAENWGGDPDRLLSFEVDPEARIVDVTKGEGLKAWNAFKKGGTADYDAFADLFGADIIRYPYDQTEQAFVVKNASVLHRAQGVHRSVISISELLRRAAKINDPLELMKLMSVNQLSADEIDYAWKASGVKASQVVPVLKNPKLSIGELLAIIGSPVWRNDPVIQGALLEMVPESRSPRLRMVLAPLVEAKHPSVLKVAEAYLQRPDIVPEEAIAVLDGLDKLGEKSAVVGQYMMGLLDYMMKKKEPPLNRDLFLTASRNIGLGKYEEKEGKRLLGLIKMLVRDKRTSIDTFTRSLLKNGQFRKEVYDMLWAHLPREKHMGDHWEILMILAEYFPEDARIPGEIERYWHESLGEMYNGLPQRIAESLKNTPNAPDIKRMLFEGLKPDHPGLELALDSLPSFPLNDRELAAYIEGDSKLSLYSRRLEKVLPDYLPKIGPDSARALTHASLVVTPEGRLGHPEELRKMLKVAFLRQGSAIQEEFERGLEAITQQKSVTVDKIRNASEMVISGSVRANAPVQEHLLSMSMGKLPYEWPEKEDRERLALLWDSLDFSDSKVSRDAQKMLVDPRFSFLLERKNVLASMEKIPDPGPELLQKLSSLKKKDMGKETRNLLAEYLTRYKPSLSGTGCGGNFARLAGDK